MQARAIPRARGSTKQTNAHLETLPLNDCSNALIGIAACYKSTYAAKYNGYASGFTHDMINLHFCVTRMDIASPCCWNRSQIQTRDSLTIRLRRTMKIHFGKTAFACGHTKLTLSLMGILIRHHACAHPRRMRSYCRMFDSQMAISRVCLGERSVQFNAVGLHQDSCWNQTLKLQSGVLPIVCVAN
jgi:hypothetical protein